MNIGERIRFFRKRRKMTQKQLGLLVGFPENCADVRIAQYEIGIRKPKEKLIAALSAALGISAYALQVPSIDSPTELMHFLFSLEDCYGFWIEQGNGVFHICADPYNNEQAARLFEMLGERRSQYEKRLSGAITKQEYDNWRCNFSGDKS